MKVIFYSIKIPHHKNIKGLKLMFPDTIITNDINKVLKFNYNLIIVNDTILEIDFPKDIKVIHGPQLFVFPSKNIKNKIINSLSLWNKKIMETINNKNTYITLPFPIEIQKFKPLELKNIQIDCIVYFKHRDPKLLNIIISFLLLKKYTFKIFEYGKYNEEDYLNFLQKTKIMIVLDAHESQGFALQEAMSCNVPLFVFDSSVMSDEYLSKYPKYLCTSVPYFDNSCGIINKSFDTDIFGQKIDYMIKNYNLYSPRMYILNTLSPEICKKRFENFIN